MALTIPIEPLTPDAFASYGAVIDVGGQTGVSINDGRATRFHRLAEIDTDDIGKPVISIFRTAPCVRPVSLKLFERHPLGSQSFVPLAGQRFLTVVGKFQSCGPSPQTIHAFLTDGAQGVHYNAGTWHHPLLNMSPERNFLVIDRDGPGDNCDEIELGVPFEIDDDALAALLADR